MIRLRNCFCLVVSLCFAPLVSLKAAATHSSISYNRDILPILSDNCFYCHGPDASRRKAKLRLDLREVAIEKHAIVPGKLEDSELVRRISSTDPDELMPPAKSNKKLSAAQIDLLRRWVAEGATYQGHWSYTPPVKPPAPRDEHAIDFLVRQRLKELGMAPSSQADRRTLARRLYFDLVGIPPKPEEVDAFEKDSAPDAYERLVERLLAMPQYGERMAIQWLDVVRYADTIGYHSDNPRNVWPFRDYVIRSFNENKPFDQFTREQLAGDLLPNPTLEQKVASGFNRLLLSTEEGGAQPKDYEARMLTDRVRAIGAVWLGQTIGCAQCHDHKFDPITSRDFYSLGAFFADIKEPIIGRREDGLLVPNAAQAAEVKRLEKELDDARNQFEAPRPQLLTGWMQAARQVVHDEPKWSILQPSETSSASGAKLSVDLNGTITPDAHSKAPNDTFTIRVRPSLQGIAAFRLETLASDQLPEGGPGLAKDGSLLITEVSVSDGTGARVELQDARATFESPDAPATAAVDGSETPDNGWAVRDRKGVAQAIFFTTRQPVDPDEELVFRIKAGNQHRALPGRFRLAATTDPAVAHAQTALPPREIATLLVRVESELSEKEHDKLAAHFRNIAPELTREREAFTAARKAKTDYENNLPHCLVSISDKPRTVRILPRGDWMNESGEVVQPALPHYLVSEGERAENGKRLTRLDLANWLVCRDNPLTARVVINRIWKQFFGMGLSKVLDDFGAQGEPPPNQPLLDWLACEFMDSGWDVKHMVRLMVLSDTYRQVSTASKDLLNRDPYNRELARQSRWRLDAELVRDNALSIAGLLVERVGGPSVKPYQPEGYWENLNFPVRTYDASPGADQYRRGLYTWWQRSYLHPSFLAFDAPTREECAADRSRSNIPQQALVLLNDPTYVEAARVFAANILREGGTDATSRITWAFQRALCREPRPDELQTIFNLLYKQLADRSPNPNLQALLQVGQAPSPQGLDPSELAAWTNVARVVLNLHETITRS